MTQQVPEGWYADPQGGSPGAERWWNGHHWTAHTRVNPVPPAPPPQQESAGGSLGLPHRRTLADGTPLAELGPRLAAYGIDVVLVWIVGTIVSGAIDSALGLAGLLTGLSWGFPFLGLGRLVRALVLGGLWLGCQVLFLRRSGTTPGKRLLGLRVRRPDGDDPLTGSEALRRAVVGGAGPLFLLLPGSQLLGLLLGGYDAYRMSNDPLGRAWHDQVVGTVVVRQAR